MKGFVFTLDAVFALIVTGAATSLLLYVYITTQVTSVANGSQAQNILNTLLSTNAGSLSNLYPIGIGAGAQYANDNELHALTQMYLTGSADYATLFISQLFPAQNVGLLINGVYAPDFEVGNFNGATSSIVMSYNALGKMPGNGFTLTAWVEECQLCEQAGGSRHL